MGGQACILYGAAEFSRDVDLAVLADDKNLERLRRALEELKAEPVFVPPLGVEVLRRGHACHFRAWASGAERLRIDVMSVLHGCDPFEVLWSRRRTVSLPGLGGLSVLSLADLVRAKKTQRDKDWLMVRRLVEADYHGRRGRPAKARVRFWMEEARTPELLAALCRGYPALAREIGRRRAAVKFAASGDARAVEAALRREEDAHRAADRAYWAPLRKELEEWRRLHRLRDRRRRR